MSLPPVVSAAEWQAARDRLLVKEKELTRALDALAAERRRLPMVRFDDDYVFEGRDGKASLVDLFGGRRQLVVYHFMLEPGAAPCEGCSSFTDNIGRLAPDPALRVVAPPRRVRHRSVAPARNGGPGSPPRSPVRSWAGAARLL